MRKVLVLLTILPACVESTAPQVWMEEAKKTPDRPNEPAEPATPPTRACLHPEDVTGSINAGSIVGSTVGLPNDLAGCGYSADSPERIYAITPTAGGTVYATTANPGTTFDTILSARNDCSDGATTFACNDDCLGSASCVSFYAEAGRTYYLLIEGWAGAAGEYELTIVQDTGEHPCPQPASDITAAINGPNVLGSTVGAPDLTGATCTYTQSGEIVYSLTPGDSGLITLSTANPGTTLPDTVVSVRMQCGDPGSQVACNDDCSGFGLASCPSFYATAGSTYFVIVEGYASFEGEFELSVTQTDDEPSANLKNPATPASPAEPATGATPGGKGGPAVPPTFRLPDLVVDEAVLAGSWWVDTRTFFPGDCTMVEGCTDAPGDRRLLNFTTRISNIGQADYVIGPPEENDAFDFDQCHMHYHYDSYAQYRLIDPDGVVVKTGGKSGFCVLDLQCEGGAAPRYDCSNQGISVGCSDVYGAGIDCQWIDVTSVPDGCYTLEVEANWQRTPAESSYDNNVARTQVCFAAPVCGDGACNPGEDCASCAADCGPCPFCGDGFCAFDEDCVSCGVDCGPCPVCGNGLCEGKFEDCVTCDADCGACPVCGDGVCEGFEDCRWCPDCGECTCSHDECTIGPPLPVGCTPCTTLVCNTVDPFCCDVEWDALCVDHAAQHCGLVCGP